MSPKQPPPSSRSRTPLLVGLVVAVVAVLAVAAVAVTSGGDDDATDGDGGAPGAVIDPMDAVVEVDGEPLPPRTADGDPAIGAVPPTLRGTNYEGGAITIEPGAEGRPTLVVFLAHWCPHCNAEVPRLLEWEASGGVPENLDVIGVSTGVNPDRPNYPPGEWLDEKGWEWPVLADDQPTADGMPPSAALAYGIDAYPFFALLDAEGRVVVRNSGELSVEDLDALSALVASA